MPFLEELSRRMNSSMDLSRLQSAVNEEERVRQNLYRAIGEQYASLHKNDPEEALASLMAEVQASFKRTEEYHGMIRTMKGLVQCPNCGADVEAHALFCMRCGTKMPQPEPPKPSPGKFCINCGAPIDAGAKFCGKCGTPVMQAAPEMPMQATPVAPVAEPPVAEAPTSEE